MIVVSDTSAVSARLRIGHGGLLHRLYGKLLISEAMRAELPAFFPSLPEFLHCRQVANVDGVNRLCEELDPGEAEAIILARETHADILLMDELNGRRIATREGVPIIGLMGLLLTAKAEQLIASIRPLIEKLKTEANFRLSSEFKQSTPQRANEL